MKVWITKYALTQGIYDVEGEVCTGQIDMFVQKNCGMISCYYHGEGKEWHRTRRAAVATAKEMRDRKIASIQKKIAKLKAMTFEEDE
jgi:hypothetical protein